MWTARCLTCGSSWQFAEEPPPTFSCLRCHPIIIENPMEDYYPEQTAKLREILEAQIRLIVEKDNVYRGSWKKRGGRGAWYTMARPLDRLEILVEGKYGGDIFKGMVEEDAAGKTGQDGSIVACLHDLRSYALLCEAWLLLQKNPMNQPPLPGKSTTVSVFTNTPGYV